MCDSVLSIAFHFVNYGRRLVDARPQTRSEVIERSARGARDLTAHLFACQLTNLGTVGLSHCIGNQTITNAGASMLAKFRASLSYLVAMARKCLILANMFSTKCRYLYRHQSIPLLFRVLFFRRGMVGCEPRASIASPRV